MSSAEGADNPLAVDVLVVDEASMLDLALATKLFEAIPTRHASCCSATRTSSRQWKPARCSRSRRGSDAECRVHRARRSPASRRPDPPRAAADAIQLHDSVIWFTENFRFAADSGIGRLAAYVNAGDGDRPAAHQAGAGPALPLPKRPSSTAPRPARPSRIESAR